MTTPTPQPTGQPPALWNPNAPACWSLLFTPAFGAFLHASNAKAMGRDDEAKANRVWFYVSIAYFVFASLTVFVPAIPEGFFRLAAMGLLLGWYFSLAKTQVRFVQETWRDDYERRPWTKPLLIALGCTVGAFAAAIVVAMLAELVLGSQ